MLSKSASKGIAAKSFTATRRTRSEPAPAGAPKSPAAIVHTPVTATRSDDHAPLTGPLQSLLAKNCTFTPAAPDGWPAAIRTWVLTWYAPGLATTHCDAPVMVAPGA